MPVQYEVDVERRLVMTTVGGVVSAADMVAYQAELVADARFSPSFDTLMEFLPHSVFTGTGDDIRQLAQSTPSAPGMRRAYVVANDLHFGLSRMAQEYADMMGKEVELFRDRAAALDWLDRGRTKE